MRRLGALLAVALLAAACFGDGDEPAERGADGGHDLEAVPLRPDEAPDGLQERARGTGPLEGIREVLPPRRTAPGLPPVPRELVRAFETGYQRLFSGGPRSAASSALRFAGPSDAAAFLALLRGVHDATVADEGVVPAPGLGEEGYAWQHVVPGAQSAGAVWRRADLVVTLVLSGPVGESTLDDVLALARRIDGRLG